MDNQTGVLEVASNGDELRPFHHIVPFVPGQGQVDLNKLWELVRTQDYAFDDSTRDNPEAFVHALMTPASANFWREDLGWVLIRDLYDGGNPDIHFVVWNDRASIHEVKAVGREIISWVFKSFKVNRITAMVPDFNTQAKRFATILRFHHEGVMKGCTLYHGKWHNVEVFGLLRSVWEGVM